MLLVGQCIVSDDIAKASFCCDLSKCKGCCCVEGDAGAPLLKEEGEVLQSLLPEKKQPKLQKRNSGKEIWTAIYAQGR